MAAFSSQAPQRRKLTTYGKGSARPSHPQFDIFDEESSPRHASTTKRIWDEEWKQSPSSGKFARLTYGPRDIHTSKSPISKKNVGTDRVAKTKPTRSLKPASKLGSEFTTIRDPHETSDTSTTDSASVKKNEVKKFRTATAKAPAGIVTYGKKDGVKKQQPLKGGISGPHLSGPSNSKAKTYSSRSRITRSRSRATTPAVESLRSPVKKGVSSPATLSAMISGSSKSKTLAPVYSTPPSSPHNGPFNRVRTPSPKPTSSPVTAIRVGTITPKQKALWTKLLDDTGHEESPSALPMSKLSLTNAKKKAFSRSISDLTGMNRKFKLVDSLKQKRQTLDEVSASDSEDDSFLARPKYSATAMDIDPTPESSQPAAPVPQSRTKVTYGQQRSYLEEKNESAMFDLLMEDLGQSTGGFGTQNSQIVDEGLEDDSQQGVPRSVHDLRAAGSKKRLLHEIESLLAGVEGDGFDSMSGRRSAMLEMTQKLFESAAVKCLLDHGLESRLMRCISSCNDTIFTFLASVSTSLLIQGAENLRVLQGIRRSGCLETLLANLDLDQDISRIVKERRMNMSKIAQSSILDFKVSVMDSNLWSEQPSKLSPRMVSLKAIELFIRKLRELHDEETILYESSITKVLDILAQRAALDILAHSDQVEMELCLSILESHSIVSSPTSRASWPSKLLKSLEATLPKLLSNPMQSKNQLRYLGLRLCLNLTNNNSRTCEMFANRAIVQPILEIIASCFATLQASSSMEDLSDESQALQLDELILSLGALINMTELNDQARVSLLDCDPALVGRVVQTFVHGLERTTKADSVESSRLNVPFGYLSLLLVNVSLSRPVRDAVRARMPGGRLEALVVAAEEFISLHQKTDSEMLDGEEGKAYTARLMGMVEKLRTVVG